MIQTPLDRAIYAMTTVRYLSAYDARVLLRTALTELRYDAAIAAAKAYRRAEQDGTPRRGKDLQELARSLDGALEALEDGAP
jgi:hypothetical protein